MVMSAELPMKLQVREMSVNYATRNVINIDNLMAPEHLFFHFIIFSHKLMKKVYVLVFAKERQSSHSTDIF